MSIQAVAAVLELPKTITGARRLVLVSLANHANDELECWPSIDTIAREAGLTRDTARKALRALEQGQMIYRRINAAPDDRIPAARKPNLYRLGPWAKFSTTGGTKSPSRPKSGGRNVPPRGGDPSRNGGDQIAPQTIKEPSKNRGGERWQEGAAAARSIRSDLKARKQ